MSITLDKRLAVRLVFYSALVVLGVWIAHHVYWDEIKLPVQFTGAAETNRWYVIERLAKELTIPTHKISSTRDLPAPSHSVLYLHGWNFGVLPERQARIKTWVQRGGRLIIDASVYGGGKELKDWLGVEAEYLDATQKKPGKRQQDDQNTSDEQPADNNTVLAGLLNNQPCPELTSTGYAANLTTARTYRICGFDNNSRLTSTQFAGWTLKNQAGPQVLRVSQDDGEVTFINGTPFTNELTLRDDNALLFAAAADLRRGDQLYFLTETQSASLLTLIWRNGYPVAISTLVLVLMMLWRQGTRFGPLLAPGAMPRRSLAEQIRGAAAFMWRAGSTVALHDACVNALQRVARQHIPHYARLDTSARIAALAAATRVNAEELALAINISSTRRSEALRAIILIETVRRRLQAPHGAPTSPT